jgi:glycosyltransferase involved in cell wall biosynthesis
MSNISMPQKLVSIALATFNGEKFLEAQLDSLLSQTYRNIEIIISDDYSTDNTVLIIEEYKKKESSIFLVKNKLEKGVNKNFENAINHCKGEYIALCDQDDVWMPHKIETLVNNIDKASLIYHNSLFVDTNCNSLNRTIADKMNCYSGDNPKTFLLFNCVSGHSCMFVRDIVDIALPMPIVKYFDWWLAFVAADNAGVKYIDEVLVHYRQHEKSKTDMLTLKKSTIHKKEFIMYNDELEWYNNCSKIVTKNKKFFQLWAKFYSQRKTQWLSFSLFFLARKNASELYKIRKNNNLVRFFESLKLLLGIKLKTLFG